MKLALAVAISDGLTGSGVALLKGDDIMIDGVSDPKPANVRSLVESFFSKRKDASDYSLEGSGESIVVRYAGLIPTDRRVITRLPRGLFQCPVCGVIMKSQGVYDAHVRVHDLARGMAT